MSWPDVADPCHSTEGSLYSALRTHDDRDERVDPAGQNLVAR